MPVQKAYMVDGKVIGGFVGVVEREDCNRGVADANFVFVQSTPVTTWTISHYLGKYPSVSIFDGSGNTVIGNIDHLSVYVLRITFNINVSGTAILN